MAPRKRARSITSSGASAAVSASVSVSGSDGSVSVSGSDGVGSGFASGALHAAAVCASPLLQRALAPAGTPLLPHPSLGAPWRAFLLLGVAPLLFFFAVAGCWAAADALVAAGGARALAAAKLQPALRPSRRDYAAAAAAAVYNFAAVGLPWAWLLVSALGPALGVAAAAVDAPWSPWELPRHLPAFLLAVEVGFYLSHRALHGRTASALVSKCLRLVLL